MKILLATQKPFAAAAVKGITDILEAAGHEVVKLEKYAEQHAVGINTWFEIDSRIENTQKIAALALS